MNELACLRTTVGGEATFLGRGARMRLFKLFVIPVIVLTGSVAQAQDYSARPSHTHNRVATDFASLPSTQKQAPEIIPAQVSIPTEVKLAPAPGPVGYENPQEVIPTGRPALPPNNGMATFGTPGCDCCGKRGCGGSCGCSDCGGCCLDRLKAWACFVPKRTCKTVCYNPIPQLYLFFPVPARVIARFWHPTNPAVVRPACITKSPRAASRVAPLGSPTVRGLVKPASKCGTSCTSCQPTTCGCATGSCASGGCAAGGCATRLTP